MTLRTSHLALLIVILSNLGPAVFGQPAQPPSPDIASPDSASPIVSPSAIQRDSDSQTYTLSVTAREIVVEVVVSDHGRSVPGLTAEDFQVFELGPHSQKTPAKISSVRAVNPANSETSHAESVNWVTLGRSCATRFTSYYMLAYKPHAAGLTSGYHEILVTTSRSHVQLSFRHRYYVGATESLAKPEFHNAAEATAALEHAACMHPDIPPSLAISARAIPTGTPDALQFVVLVSPDSLSFTSLAENVRHAQFDYAVCTLNAAGTPVRFIQAAVDHILTPNEYAQVLGTGFGNLMRFERKNNPVFARFIVRDRRTGNIGFVGVAIPPVPKEWTQPGAQPTGGTTPATDKYKSDIPASSFGIPVPYSDALCGDVYEIPPTTYQLPDLWTLEPLGSVYTYNLNVPSQLIEYTIGIPGVTTRTSWFAIDYHGEFWVTEAGQFQFDLESDDGSQLYIDDQLVINVNGIHPVAGGSKKIQLDAGHHTIHIPYFQGPPRSVALMLNVKAPGGKLRPFDPRDFPPPADPARISF